MQIQVRHRFARGELELVHHIIPFGGRGEIRGRQRSGQEHEERGKSSSRHENDPIAYWEAMRFLLALLTLLPMAGAANRTALRNPNHPFWRQHSPAQYRVRVETSRGAFVLEVHRDWAPIGADRFYNLVRAGFYDDSRFYRVTARFAQFGIPGDPSIAAIWRTPTLPDDPVRESNTRGRFAFAMTGPNTRTTQIYICKTDMSAQDKDGFAPLGTVVKGMDRRRRHARRQTGSHLRRRQPAPRSRLPKVRPPDPGQRDPLNLFSVFSALPLRSRRLCVE